MLTTYEEERINELKTFRISYSEQEKKLDKIVKIASLICNVPIALITIIDKDRQWFKAKKGLSIKGTRREDSFCTLAIESPNKVLIVEDATQDERFCRNPLVKEDPHIRFYAGVPLKTKNGHALGTLCVIDTKVNKISIDQKEALTLLAEQAMDYLNSRRIISKQKKDLTKRDEMLLKITQNIPSTIFQLRKKCNGSFKYDFMSLGDYRLPESISLNDLMSDPTLGFELIHPDDRSVVQEALDISYSTLENWYAEYRSIYQNELKWFMVKAKPEKLKNGDVVWYGIFQDITEHVAYEEALEQIAFDISHILRAPVANLLGLSNLIKSEKGMNEEELKAYADHIRVVSTQMDIFTHELNIIYNNKLDTLMYNNQNRRT